MGPTGLREVTVQRKVAVSPAATDTDLSSWITCSSPSPATPGGKYKIVIFSSSCDPVGFLKCLSTTAFIVWMHLEWALNSAHGMYIACSLHNESVMWDTNTSEEPRRRGQRCGRDWDWVLEPSLEVSWSTQYSWVFTVCPQGVLHFCALH